MDTTSQDSRGCVHSGSSVTGSPGAMGCTTWIDKDVGSAQRNAIRLVAHFMQHISAQAMTKGKGTSKQTRIEGRTLPCDSWKSRADLDPSGL